MSADLKQSPAPLPPCDTARLAYTVRRWALTMVHHADASHIGGALSSADIISVLYGRVLNLDPQHPEWEDRDRFVLSKGHCCSVLYAALAVRGFFPVDWLPGYAQSGSILMGHASHKVPGVEWSTGSLGHGLSLAAGQAYAGKIRKAAWKVFALLSDGEVDEGSTWEAVMFAAHHKLSNLCVIIDRNGQQALGDTEKIISLGDIAAKFEAFGWDARTVDGHNMAELEKAMTEASDGRPRCIVAKTLKGRGVKYMEDEMEWHYRAPKTEELLQEALSQLEEAYPGLEPLA